MIAGEVDVAEIESSVPVSVEAAANVGVGATAASWAGVCAAGVEAGRVLTVDLGAVAGDERETP